MKTEKFNLSVLDLKGLFCDVLARHLNDGTLTREFVADMKKRGVLTDAKKAKEFESVCTIEKGGKSVNITKLMALMGLGVKQGDTVTVTCEGADEDKASEALKAFFEETL